MVTMRFGLFSQIGGFNPLIVKDYVKKNQRQKCITAIFMYLKSEMVFR